MLKIKQLALALLPLIFVGANVSAGQLNKRMTISSPGLSFVSQAERVGALNPNKKIDFTVWLKLRNRAELEQFVRDVYNPHSPKYQHFLTGKDIQSRYSPSPDTVNAVQHYFSSHGMDAKIVNNSVRVEATVKQIEQIFQVKMNEYRFQKKTVYSNASAPTLSPDIAQYVRDVTGLSTIPLFHPMFVKRPDLPLPDSTSEPHELNFVWDSFMPNAQPTTTSIGSGFTGAQLRTTYNMAAIPSIQGVTIDGSGQTIVIIDNCGTETADEIMADANAYNTANGLTPFSSANFIVTNPDGTPATCTTHDSGWNAEIALDVQSSHTIAPGANTVLVLANSDSGLAAAVNTVIEQLLANNFTLGGFANAYVVSNSWGATESSGNLQSIEERLSLAAGSKIAFNFSTGDCGDDTNPNNACNNGPYPSRTLTPDVNYPSSSPYVTAVGGTTLFVDSNYNYAFESGWGTHVDGNQDIAGGAGGGISQIYGPVGWQSDISGFYAGGYNNGPIDSYNTCGTGSDVCRALPDVGMLADWYTGLSIYINAHPPQVYGGTSLACPLFAGTLTLINQARTLLNNGVVNPLGLGAPYLYQQNTVLKLNQALNLVVPPHQIFGGATPAGGGAPLSAFTIATGESHSLTFSWDSSLSIEPENQYWNDVVGVGTPNLPNFVIQMAMF